MKRVLWWICLLLAPAVLIALELFHPANFTAQPGMYQYLSQAEPHAAHHQALGYFGPGWWVVLHMIQTPMVGLVAVGLLLMVDGIGDDDGPAAVAAAWLARAAIFVMVIYFTALDAIGGIGLGRSILTVQSLAAAGKLNPQQVEGAALLLNTLWVDPLVGGVGSFISQAASWAAFAATAFIAAALLLARRAGWLNMVVLLAFGWELQTSHAAPHGPIAFALLIVAALWLWLGRRRAASMPPT